MPVAQCRAHIGFLTGQVANLAAQAIEHAKASRFTEFREVPRRGSCLDNIGTSLGVRRTSLGLCDFGCSIRELQLHEVLAVGVHKAILDTEILCAVLCLEQAGLQLGDSLVQSRRIPAIDLRTGSTLISEIGTCDRIGELGGFGCITSRDVHIHHIGLFRALHRHSPLEDGRRGSQAIQISRLRGRAKA